LKRLGGKRTERRLVESLEELATARVVDAHGARVDELGQLEQSAIEIAEARERLVADASEQPTLRDLHADFDLSLVARRLRARGQDRSVVVAGELSSRALHGRVIATGFDHGALELIGILCPASLRGPDGVRRF
jgi:hypothetical protein